MARRTIVIGLGLVALVVAIAIVIAPHHWAGRLWCDVQGGEWTNRFVSQTEEIVTGGHTCVKG